MARVRRATVSRSVTTRTIRNRAKRAEAVATAKAATRKVDAPETLGQARVWTRKCTRYGIAGLCPRCAAQAAYGHAQGFAEIKDPCTKCQSLVSAFPAPGPRGSKWRKILDKLEYMSESELSNWFDNLTGER